MASSSLGSESRLFALIIGIDDYTEETGFDKLKGAVPDADSIRSWLIKDFNVPLSHIRDLRDKAATREAIIQALQDLSADPRIQRDDPILIYYAGHGTEAPAPKQWRCDSPKVQMIVPWDFKRPDDSKTIIQGIPDRTLGALLTKLAEKKGNNITVIFDSCHSGPGTRSESDSRVRGGPYKGEIPPDLDDDIVRGARFEKFRHHGLVRSHVLLAACALQERAYETKSSGAFTRALLKALNGANAAELTYEGLIDQMDALTRQNPQCEGRYKGRFLFNRKATNVKPVLDATLKRGQMIVISAGAIHGISVGSKFAIWKSISDLQADPVAIVTVDVVRGYESTATFETRVGTCSFVAQIKENPKPELFIHVPEVIQNMDCFKNLFPETENRPPLSIALTKDKSLATIGLTYLDQNGEIGFEMLNPEEQDQKICHTIEATAEDLHRALDHLCHYYYHRDRVNSKPLTIGDDKTPFSSKFTIDVFTLKENDEGIYEPDGPSLNIQGTGVQLTVGPHNEEDNYGFRITNNTDISVFPYLFYFNSSDFSITPVYEPVAESQTGAKESPTHSLSGHSSLTIGYGPAGAVPQNLAILNEEMDLEQGYLRLYVSTQHVDLSTLAKGPISAKTRGYRPSTPKRLYWDAITVPVVIRRGEKPPSIPMVGIIGSRSNGKSTFLKELSISLYGNASLKPSFKNAFISEYTITLPGPNEETLTLVDLPAFEDNNIDNHASVLKATVAYLGEQYQKGHPLTSLIWCYDISKPRFTVVDGENFNLVKDIFGPNALKNVTVLTTNWSKGAGVDAAKPQTVAGAAAPLRHFENVESALKSLCGGVVDFRRFGTSSDPAGRRTMLGSTSSGDPLELIRSLMSHKEDLGFQVQREACGTRKLAGTTAGKRLQRRLEAEIQNKEKVIEGLVYELDDDMATRCAIQVEREDAKQDILRWRGTLEEIRMVNSVFLPHGTSEPEIGVHLDPMGDGLPTHLSSTSQESTPGGTEHKPLVVCRSTCFGAKDAFDHLARRQEEIIKAVTNLQSPIVALAGFNEELVRGGACLLQEIHIFPATELSLEQCDLVEVGKLSAPFPAVIFLPSGKTIRPPLYNAQGQVISADQMVASSIRSWGYPDRQTKGFPTPENLPVNAPSDGSGASRFKFGSPGSQSAAGSSMELSGNEDLGKALEESEEGGAKVALGSEDSSPRIRNRKVRFDVLGRIHHDQANSKLVEEFQLTGDLDFGFVPTRGSARVEFTQMRCQARREHSHPTIPFQYLQSYLKVLINTGDPLWKSTKITPKATAASEDKEKRVQSDKTAFQTGFKACVSPNIFKSSVTGEVTQTGEDLKSAERVYNRDRIIQDERLGVFRWDYHVDDKNDKERGVELPESRLPFIEMKYATRDMEKKPEQLKIEVSSFWSLAVERSVMEEVNAPGQIPLPAYSNLCQDVWFDLGPIEADADVDDDYIAILTVDPSYERLQVINESHAIYFTPGIRKPSNLDEALKKIVSS